MLPAFGEGQNLAVGAGRIDPSGLGPDAIVDGPTAGAIGGGPGLVGRHRTAGVVVGADRLGEADGGAGTGAGAGRHGNGVAIGNQAEPIDALAGVDIAGGGQGHVLGRDIAARGDVVAIHDDGGVHGVVFRIAGIEAIQIFADQVAAVEEHAERQTAGSRRVIAVGGRAEGVAAAVPRIERTRGGMRAAAEQGQILAPTAIGTARRSRIGDDAGIGPGGDGDMTGMPRVEGDPAGGHRHGFEQSLAIDAVGHLGQSLRRTGRAVVGDDAKQHHGLLLEGILLGEIGRQIAAARQIGDLQKVAPQRAIVDAGVKSGEMVLHIGPGRLPHCLQLLGRHLILGLARLLVDDAHHGGQGDGGHRDAQQHIGQTDHAGLGAPPPLPPSGDNRIRAAVSPAHFN